MVSQEREDELREALSRIKAGDEEAAASLLERHRSRLQQMVAWRMHRDRLPGVVPADIVTRGLGEAARHFRDVVSAPDMPFYIWLRGIVLEHLAERRDAQEGGRRPARKTHVPAELAPEDTLPEQSLDVLASLMVNREPGVASVGPLTAETLDRVRAEIRRLPSEEREVLILRHLEHVAPSEVALILGCSQAAAKVHYMQALKRIHAVTEA